MTQRDHDIAPKPHVPAQLVPVRVPRSSATPAGMHGAALQRERRRLRLIADALVGVVGF